VKAVAVVEASADTVFEVLLNIDKHQRYESAPFLESIDVIFT
jgi:hypothetical protein